MSWSVSAKGSKADAVDAINKEHERGHMPASHRDACVAEVDQCDAEVLTVSAYGHRNVPPTGGNMSVTVSKVS